MSDALERLLHQQVARFTERRGDWDAFADARVEGFRRAQHRFIVICLEHEDVELVQRPGDVFRHVTEIVDDPGPYTFHERRHDDPNRLICIVGDGNRLDIEVSDYDRAFTGSENRIEASPARAHHPCPCS